MSVKTMAMVWDLDNELINREEKFVLLAYVDHADHEGNNIFPSVLLICRKTGYSERSIQNITRSLKKKGFLIPEGKGPKGTNKWSFGGGAEIAGVQKTNGGGAKVSLVGVQHTAPESLRTISEPSNTFSEKENEQMKKKVYAIIGSGRPENYYKGRELIRDNLLVLADWYNKATGQEMTKRVQRSWWKALTTWNDAGLTPEHLQIAFETQSAWRMVSDPNMLTNDAVAVKASGGKAVIKPGMPERSSMLRTIS